MIIGFEENGFEISCKKLPDGCIDCPFSIERFQGYEIPNAEICFITGDPLVISKHTKVRASNCPLKEKN